MPRAVKITIINTGQKVHIKNSPVRTGVKMVKLSPGENFGLYSIIVTFLKSLGGVLVSFRVVKLVYIIG